MMSAEQVDHGPADKHIDKQEDDSTQTTPAKPDKRARWVSMAALLVACLIMLAAIVMSIINGQQREHALACTPDATAMLPPGVVAVVARSQAQDPVRSDVFVRDLLPRDGTAAHNPWVFVHFEPQYCGFVANINYSDAVTDKANKDVVVIFGAGKASLDADPNRICISNTVPKAYFNEKGGATLELSCDRTYPSDTWLQDQPKLN